MYHVRVMRDGTKHIQYVQVHALHGVATVFPLVPYFLPSLNAGMDILNS